MNKKFSITGLGLLAFILGLAALPADAQNYKGHLAGVQAQTVANLNTQRSQIETRVQSALVNGSISQSQANAIRAQLSQNANLQSQFLGDGIIDVGETQNVMSQLSSIDSSLTTGSVTTVPVFPGAGPGFSNHGSGYNGSGYNGSGYRGNRSNRNVARINEQRSDLAAKITSYLSDKKLSTPQAQAERDKLTYYSSLQVQYLVDGNLSKAEYDRLNNAIATIDASVENKASINLSHGGWNRGGGWDNPGRGYGYGRRGNSQFRELVKVQNSLEKQIEDGRSNGSLTTSEYAALQLSAERLAAAMEKVRTTNNNLTALEVQQVTNLQNNLQARITAETSDSQVAMKRRWGY